MNYKIINGRLSRINKNGYTQMSQRSALMALNRQEKEIKNLLERLQQAHEDLNKTKEK